MSWTKLCVNWNRLLSERDFWGGFCLGDFYCRVCTDEPNIFAEICMDDLSCNAARVSK